mgnify:CR=1 FL=1
MIKNNLNSISGVNAEIFVGQAKKKTTGLSQKEQKKLLDNFILEKKVRQQSQHLESILYKQNLEEEMAFYVYTHMLGSVKTPDFISFSSLSTDNFSGDIQLSATAPSGIHYVLLADATGHGLSAAISLFPLISIFKAMIKKGFPIRLVLEELNLKLNEYIPPDRFITVILVELDVKKRVVGIWNGGMPTVLYLSKENKVINNFPSKNMALGILEENEFDNNVVYMPLPSEGKLLMYSDGLIEQCDSDGKEYGELRLHSLLECYSGDDLLEEIMNSNSDFRDTSPLDDDISVSVLDFSKII